jgi:hypothetical protein
MVLLTMTPSIVEGLKQLPQALDTNSSDTEVQSQSPLDEPATGKPISHGQVIELWKALKLSEAASSRISLEELLRGSQVYVPPPPPKPEPTPEYKALMARLRREEETRSYERMVNPPTFGTRETFNQRFPYSSAQAFASVNQPISKEDMGDDDVTYNDVNRQVMLIINFVVSILGVAGTLWVAAKWWSVPARLFLTMGGSAVVAVAEVSVYSIYVWKMGDAKKRQEASREVKEVVETWVVGKDKDTDGADIDKDADDAILLKNKVADDPDALRKRVATGKQDDT